MSSKWRAMLECGQTYCLGNAQGPGYKCALDAAGSMLIDRPGDPVNTCGKCLNDALARAFGSACANLSSADCDPAACKATNDACLNDVP